MKNRLSIAVLLCSSLGACTSTINMPLDYAKLADGYVNSSNMDFGHVFVWDTSSNRIASIYRITPGMVSADDVDSGPRYSEKTSSVSHDTKIEVSGAPAADITASATAQFINSTDVKLINYNPREYKDAQYVLNSPTLRSWRERLGEEYTDPKYRFVFISRVTDGDEIQIGRKASGEVGADANVVKVGKYKFKVSYNNQTSATVKAKQAPLTVQPAIFTFSINKDKSPVEYRFHRDLTTRFSFQSVNQ